MFALLLALAVPLHAADDVFDSVAGHDCFRELLRKSGWGLAGPYERAAFVVEQSDGSIACEEWPSLHSYHSEEFHGMVPPHTIAIAHTHPAEYPLPSPHDDDEATRLGIAIYTITVRGVYKSLPGGPPLHQITNKHSWIDEKPGLAAAAALRPDKFAVDLNRDRLSDERH